MPLLFIVFFLLTPAATASLAYAYNYSVLHSTIIGFGIGALPPIFARLPGRIPVIRLLAWFSQLLLIITSIAVAQRALQLVVEDITIYPNQILPLLFAVVSLYIFYLLILRLQLSTRTDSVPACLTSLFSGPPLILTLAMAATISSYILVAMHYFRLSDETWVFIATKFLDRGIIPPLTVLLFFWGLLILANKGWTLWLENRLQRAPENHDRSILMQTYYHAVPHYNEDHVQHYFNMIWKKSSDFYVIPRYINWSIPILGFIGTVLGISLAADGIQRIIGSAQGLTHLSNELGNAIAPLGIAFDTTLIALSLSVVLMLIQTAMQRWENDVLVDYENRVRNML